MQMGGLTNLLFAFLGLNINSLETETKFSMKCIELLAMTMTWIISYYSESTREQIDQFIKQLLQKKEQVVHTCMRFVEMITDYCIAQEKARGKTLDELQKRDIQNKANKDHEGAE